MQSTHIRKADLVIDMEGDGSVRVVRQSNGQGIQFSLSEWCYLQKVAELHGWPVVPPSAQIQVTEPACGTPIPDIP